MTRMKVLVTGMSGLIGGLVKERLAGTCELSAVNRSDVAGVTCHRADIADFQAIRPAFTGQDTVVHLAAKAGEQYTWEELQAVNVVGTYNVFEAAREAGVRRVIYASSGATVSGWEQEDPYRTVAEGRYDDAPASWPMLTHQTPTRPSGVYGASKVWGEALARHYTDTTDLSIICLRIGHVTKEDRPLSARDFAVWCSQRDIARMVESCVAAPADLKFDTFFVVSDNRWGYRDLSHAHEVLGFEPQDRAEDHR